MLAQEARRAFIPAPVMQRANSGKGHWPLRGDGVTSNQMAEQLSKSWLRRRVENGLRRGFHHAYKTVRVDPSRFLLQLRSAYGLPITSFQGLYSVDMRVLDDVAEK